MIKNCTLLNAEILSTIARMGHTDSITISDCGLPIPESTNRIDLALKKDVPTFLETLDVVLSAFQPELAIIAEEIKKVSPIFHSEMIKKLGSIEIEYVSHDEFIELTSQSKACIRTGECTAYANIILVSGSLF